MLGSRGGETPNNPLWEYERALGDILAGLHTIRQHAEVAQDHADNADLRYPEDSLNQIYVEMAEQLRQLEEFQLKLLRVQAILLKAIKDEGEERILPFRKASGE